MGEPSVPELKEYVERELFEGRNIGFDGRVVTAGEGLEFERIAQKKGGKVIWNLDLASGIWKERPKLSFTPVYVLEERYCGESAQDKLQRPAGQNAGGGCFGTYIDNTGRYCMAF